MPHWECLQKNCKIKPQNEEEEVSKNYAIKKITNVSRRRRTLSPHRQPQSTDLTISFILPDHVGNHALPRLTIFHFDII